MSVSQYLDQVFKNLVKYTMSPLHQLQYTNMINPLNGKWTMSFHSVNVYFIVVDVSTWHYLLGRDQMSLLGLAVSGII